MRARPMSRLFGALALLAFAAPAAAQSPRLTIYQHETTLRFSLAHPESWRADRPERGPVLVRISDRDGRQCTASIDVQKRIGDGHEIEAPRAAYLAHITADRMRALFRPEAGAELRGIEPDKIGGVPAKRMELSLRSPQGRRFVLRQWATLVKEGAFSLSCAAPEEIFATPETQAAIKAVQESLAFK